MKLGPAWTNPGAHKPGPDEALSWLRAHMQAAAKARSEGRLADARLHARAALQMLAPADLKLLFAEVPK
jgi:hypothetical protein